MTGTFPHFSRTLRKEQGSDGEDEEKQGSFGSSAQEELPNC